MAFIVPLIAGAVGLSATGTAIAQIAVGIGLSFAAKKLTGKKKAASDTSPGGVRLGLQIDTNPPRQVIIGEAATPGSLVYWQLSGTDNSTLHMVFALADHECDSLQKVLVNGKEKARDAGTGQIAGYGSDLIVRFYAGTLTQAADTDLVATSGGRWTTAEKGLGVCYAVVRMVYDEAKFPDGIPDFLFVVRGAKLYDPRTGSTAWSDNPAVAIYNVLRGISVGGEPLLGMNVPADAIRTAEAQAAANACDEAVAKKAGGTEKRYRCNVVIDTSMTNRDIIETLLASMAGECIESGGIYRIMAGVAHAPVVELTDDDLIVTEPLVTRDKRSRNEITNAILGSYTDPTRAYTNVPLPPRTSSADEDEDGGIRLSKTFDLSAVTSRSQAQRVMEVERRRARRMGSAQMRIRARWFVLEPGDWVTYTSDRRRGYVSKTFVVQSKTGNRDLTSDIVLVETDAGIDDWTASIDDIDDSQVIDLASAGPGLSEVTGITLANVTITSAGSVQRPGLNVQWTPITDPTITDLQCEFRRVGDTVALTTNLIIDPSSGSYTWVTGVQSGATYEARLRPVARPQRPVNWSSWVAVTATSSNQVVAVAAYAETVNPAGIPPAVLSAQDRFELSLITQTDDVLGSISQQVADTVASAEKAHAATVEALLGISDNRASIRVEQRLREQADISLAEQITTVLATFDTQAAQVQSQLTALASDVDAQAAAIQTVTTAVEGQTAQVIVLAESINGVEGKFGVAVTANKEVMASDKDAFNRFFHAMLDAGVYLAPSAFEAGFVSAAHTDADIAATVAAADAIFAAG
jgi:hypothetical protein